MRVDGGENATGRARACRGFFGEPAGQLWGALTTILVRGIEPSDLWSEDASLRIRRSRSTLHPAFIPRPHTSKPVPSSTEKALDQPFESEPVSVGPPTHLSG